ncbi:MAG: bifunctional diguanylate cyclase/phosphodiesterase [Treponemataceae bacterium]
MESLRYIYQLIYIATIIVSLGTGFRRLFYEKSDFAIRFLHMIVFNALSMCFYTFMTASASTYKAYRFAMLAIVSSILMFPFLVSLTLRLGVEYNRKNIANKNSKLNNILYVATSALAFFQAIILILLISTKPYSLLCMKPISFHGKHSYVIYSWTNSSVYSFITNIMNMLQLNLIFFGLLYLQKLITKKVAQIKLRRNIFIVIMCNVLIFLFDNILPTFNICLIPPIAPIVFVIMLVPILDIVLSLTNNKILGEAFSLKILDTLEDAIAFIDNDFKIIYTNIFFKKMFEEENVLYEHIKNFLPPNFDLSKFKNDYSEVIEINTSKKLYLQLNYVVQNDAYGDFLGGVLIFQNITNLMVNILSLTHETKNINKRIYEKNKQIILQNRRLKNQIKQKVFFQDKNYHLLKTDTLTQTFNRDYFLVAVENKIQKKEKDFAVFSVDTKGFNYVNDLKGHWLDDTILIKVSEIVKTFLDGSDIIARSDNDNFLILRDSISNASEAMVFVRALSDRVSEIKNINNFEVFIKMLIGVCIYEVGMTADEIINNAEIANLQASFQNDTQFVVFTPEISNQITNNFKLVREIKKDCETNRFIPCYQPQVLVKRDGTKKIIGYEALVRWQHDERGLLTPFHFIEVAERSGTIVQISYSILRQACETVKYFLKNGFNDFLISVNLSAKQFNNENFLKTVKNIFNETKVETKYLEFEITETNLLAYSEVILAKCIELKKMGIKISIDDFGVAFASFSYIKRLPIDKMKIDKSFVDKIGKDARTEEILCIIMEFAKACGLQIVVEGVEEKEQLDFLLQHEDNIIIQGYYFYKPLLLETLVNKKIFPQTEAGFLEEDK